MACADASAQVDGLAIYISADMEGVAGAVTGEQRGPGGFESEFLPAASQIAVGF